MIGHTLRHGDELHSLIIEGMVEGWRSRGKPRARYIIQIMQDAGDFLQRAQEYGKW